ncbi:hypothetical protein HK101_011963, partial [Irineochytrium annulatum]
MSRVRSAQPAVRLSSCDDGPQVVRCQFNSNLCYTMYHRRMYVNLWDSTSDVSGGRRCDRRPHPRHLDTNTDDDRPDEKGRDVGKVDAAEGRGCQGSAVGRRNDGKGDVAKKGDAVDRHAAGTEDSGEEQDRGVGKRNVKEGRDHDASKEKGQDGDVEKKGHERDAGNAAEGRDVDMGDKVEGCHLDGETGNEEGRDHEARKGDAIFEGKD